MEASKLFVALFVLVGSVAACSRSEAPAPTAAAPPGAAKPEGEKPVQRATVTPVKPLDQKKFGGEITEKSSTPLDVLVKDPSKFTSKTVRTEGKVAAVCEHMGCWMEIADDAGTAHVKMAGHKFFVPREANGHRAVIQGKVLTGDKDHCADEAEKQTGRVAKIEIEANAIEFID